MTNPFVTAISKATALTRAGKLADATALIQSSLNGGAAKATTNTIEGTFVRLDPPHPKPKAARTPLGETLRRIAAGGMPKARPHRTPQIALPNGAEFLSLTHTSRHGSRDYRLYIPGNRTERMPLVIMLHGCTQSPEDFATGTGMNALAEEFGCVIAYPGQPIGANAQKCWNWFRPEDQVNGQGEPALIAGLTRDILRDFPTDAARVYLAGLSAGGAAAMITGSAYPDIFSAIGVHSGLPVGAAHDVPSAFAAMRNGGPGTSTNSVLPTVVFHGLADTTVHAKNGRAIVSQVLEHFPGHFKISDSVASRGVRTAQRTRYVDGGQRVIAELWEVEGAGHSWAGGRADGSYTDPTGPDASRWMMQFFLQHAKT